MSDTRKRSRNWKHAGVCLAMCLAAFAVLWAFRQQGGLEYLELKTYDVLLRSESRDYSFSSRFLLVEMDDADIARYGYPIPDETLQKLIARLQEAGPRAIGVDIIRDRPEPPVDARFGAPLKPGWNNELRDFLEDEKNWNVSWAALKLVSNAPVTAPLSEDRWGEAGTEEDTSDKCIRRALLLEGKKGGKTYLSLAYQMALNYLEREPTPLDPKPAPGDPNLIQIGPAIITRFHRTDGAYIDANDSGYQYLLDYRGSRELPHVSVTDVLESPVPRAAIHDKIIVIGMTTLTAKDFVRTPVNDKMFGVLYQAIAAEHLLRFALRGGHPISSWSDTSEAAWALAWALL